MDSAMDSAIESAIESAGDSWAMAVHKPTFIA